MSQKNILSHNSPEILSRPKLLEKIRSKDALGPLVQILPPNSHSSSLPSPTGGACHDPLDPNSLNIITNTSFG